LWAGVAPIEPLKALHRKIDLACVRAGAEPERRAYAPHISLARLGRGAGPAAPFLESVGSVTSSPFEVTEFHLYESVLTADGADYALIERYPLD
jgi:2'-5' RNA ligase